MQANNPYLFYLSYAAHDRNSYLEKFYFDLRDDVAARNGLDAEAAEKSDEREQVKKDEDKIEAETPHDSQGGGKTEGETREDKVDEKETPDTEKPGTPQGVQTQDEQKQGKVDEQGDDRKTDAESALDLNPDNLDTLASEVEFVEHLTPLLGRSPRSLKRFINTYRLVKASLSPAERAAFLDDTSDTVQFQLVLFLLSIVTGLPLISKDLFKSVMDAHDSNARQDESGDQGGKVKLKRVIEFGTLLPESSAPLLEPGDRVQPLKPYDYEWAQLIDWLDNYQNGAWKKIDIEELVEWMPRIARYSFNIRGL